MKKVFLIAIVFLVVIITCGCNSNQQEDTTGEITMKTEASALRKEVLKEKDMVLKIYSEYNSDLEIIQSYFWETKPNVASIQNNGTITLSDGTTVSPEAVTDAIKTLKTEAIQDNISSMYYLKDSEPETFIVYWYFEKTKSEIGLAYSTTDLSENDTLYSLISGNWYVYEGYMT